MKQEKDELFETAKQLSIEMGYCSNSLLMRRLELGYNRAGLLIDQLEDAKIIEKFTGSRERKVLVLADGCSPKGID